MTLSGKPHIVSVAFQPIPTRVILHGAERRIFVLNPNLHGPNLFQPLRRQQNGDPVQLIGQHSQGARAFLAVFPIDQCRFNMNRPALDLSNHRIEPDSGHLDPLRRIRLIPSPTPRLRATEPGEKAHP